MPIFEYRCSDCNSKFEILHKSSSSTEEVVCPKCNSQKNKKLLSTFSASMNGSSSFSASDYSSDSSCSTGSCGCGSGTCGLN